MNIVIWISHIRGAIDDTHIKLTQKPKVALVRRDDCIKNDSHRVLL